MHGPRHTVHGPVCRLQNCDMLLALCSLWCHVHTTEPAWTTMHCKHCAARLVRCAHFAAAPQPDQELPA